MSRAAPGERVEVVLALGANLGDREATLRGGVEALRATDGLEVTGLSPLVSTEPVGGPEQPDYLNAVVSARTTLAPGRLLAACQGVEARFGRERLVRWGPRTLDIDLIAYGAPGSASEVVLPAGDDGAALTLPHPRAHLRAFVLRPWAALDPHAELRLPDGSVRLVTELLGEGAPP